MARRVSIQDGVIAIAFAGAVALYWKLRVIDPATAAPAGNFETGDMWLQIYPMWYRAARWLRAGAVPLWNPFQFCGQPFLATAQYGLLYPLNFPFLVLPTEVAMELITMVHVFAAGWFMYLYGRGMRLSQLGAAAAGVTFMWSGFVHSQAAWFITALEAAVWLPLAFLAVERIVERRRLVWAALLASTIAMPILSGYLQTWMYSVYAIGAYAMVRLAVVWLGRAPQKQLATICGLLGAAFVLGVCLAAVQLLPTVEMQRLSPRGPGKMPLAQMFPWGATPPARLLADAVRPSFFGFTTQMYLGMAALILMPLSLLADRGRVRLVYLWCLALGSIGLALTVYTPLFPFYLLLPTTRWFRCPERVVFLYAFAGAALSGVAMDVLVRLNGNAPRHRRFAALGIVTLVGCLWLVGVDMTAESRIYIGTGMACVWGAVAWRGRMLRRVLVAALMGLLVCDLFHATRNNSIHPYHGLAPLSIEHETFDFIKQQQGLYRTYIHSSWSLPQLSPKQGTLAGIYSVTDYEPLTLLRYQNFFQLLQRADVPAFDASPSPFTGAVLVDPSPGKLRLLDLMSVRYILAPKLLLPFQQALAAAGWRPAMHAGGSEVVVYENPTALPRAYIARAPIFAPDDAAALLAVAQPFFDPRRNVVIEAVARGQLPSVADDELGITEARIVSYEPERVVITSDGDRPGYLVLTDAFYPGWKSYVDGKEQSVERANYLFRAVLVPAGSHTVAFVYEPLSFKIGAGISLVALCCLVSCVVLQRRHSPR